MPHPIWDEGEQPCKKFERCETAIGGEGCEFMPTHQCPLCRVEVTDEDGEKSFEYGERALCGNCHLDHHRNGWESCRKNSIPDMPELAESMDKAAEAKP